MKKKILFITSESIADAKRGTPIRILNFMRQMAKEFELHVAAPATDPALPAIFEMYHPGTNLRSILHYVSLVRRLKIDVVMTATDIGIALPVFIKLLSGVNIAIDLHGLYAQEMLDQGHMPAWKSWLVQKKTNICLRFYDLIFVVSGKLKSYYSFIHSPVEVIYGGVNESEFHSAKALPPAVFTIGYTGNAKEYQGVDNLLVAASRIRQAARFPFRLNLIMSSGKGESEARLEELGLADITDFHSKVSHEEVNALIGASHVLVIPRPSLLMTEYAYPSKLPEYLATGVPVIITDVGPVSELLKGRDCSIIVDATRTAIADNIEKALVEFQSLNSSVSVRMGKNAVDLVKKELTWDTLGSKVNNALSCLVNTR